MKILVFGSCRVGGPLQSVREIKERVTFVARDVVFTHSAQEALQQVKMLRGEHVPPAMLPYLWDEREPCEIDTTSQDVCVLEVCTRKAHECGEWLIPMRTHKRTGGPPGTVVREMADAEVLAGVRAFIRYMAPMPVLVVTHIDADFPGVGRLPNRAAIAAPLYAMHGINLFDPSPIVDASGAARAMADDCEHYRDDYRPVIGRAIWRRCKELVYA
jgi:hypothetical protein